MANLLQPVFKYVMLYLHTVSYNILLFDYC